LKVDKKSSVVAFVLLDPAFISWILVFL